MKKRIMKRQLLAVAMAMALVVPQGVYAVEEDNTNISISEELILVNEESGTIDILQNDISKNAYAEEPIIADSENELEISGNTLKGFDNSWLKEIKEKYGNDVKLKVVVPTNITEIEGLAFNGQANLVAVDMSGAKKLENIGKQAFYTTGLKGIIEIGSGVKNIGTLAFASCKSIQGVILPETLEVLGAEDGASGSVFKDCTGLQFVRTAGRDTDTVFELPPNLRVIGKDTFNNIFSGVGEIIAKIPASVETIGSQAFYKTQFSQVYIERQTGFAKYHSDAFKNVGLLIFKDSDGYRETGKFTRTTKTYPVVLNFINGTETVPQQTKLYDQVIGYEYDKNVQKWVLNEDYELPEVPDTEKIPGYDAGWKIEGGTEILTNVSKVSGSQQVDQLNVVIDNRSFVSKPTVKYKVGDQIMEDTTGIPLFTVEFSENQPAYVGVEVTHPLATEDAKATGTYVYYEYCWWDEYENSVNGPRSTEEPELFSNAKTSTEYEREYTDQTMIPMRKEADTRIDGNYYLVEIFGYYVEDNGEPEQYYKSRHNFIAGDNATDRSYLMHVDVKEKEKFTITPVDMTIYMGGDDGYEGVVGNDGNLVEEETSYNTLPEPLFQIMSASAGFDPESLTITNEKTHNSWNPEKVGDTEYYRLVPTAGEKKLIRVQFIDDNKNVHESDTFDPATVGDLFATYDIKIFSQGDKISVKDEDGKEYAVSTAAGKLTVRAVAENKPNDDPTIDVIDENNLTKVEAGKAVAVASEGTKYYLNNTDVEVTDVKPSLLFDSIIEDEGSTDRTKALMVKADETLGVSAGKRIYEIKYLDLVDANNGNAWIKADKPVTIYWGYPEGTDQNTEFQIVHFRDLHRDGAQSGQELEDIKNCTAEKITGVENTPEGIKFSVGKDGFSPFALIFNEKDEGGNQGGSSSGGSLTSNTYYVRYHNDDDIVKDGRFVPGETVTVRGDIFTAPRGKVLAGWSLEENGKVDYKVGDTFRMPGSSYDLYAVWKNAETLTHAAYISGYPDGTVGPDRTITRAEAATMFYNLLSNKSSTARTFADVPMNQWYANAVTTLAGMGVINGYPDGTFKPDAPITRAEFVTMAMNFAKADKGTACSFADVLENMWYYGAIAGATENGWISGYPDGTFGPARNITRAEVTSVINRMENRAADMMFIVENLNDLRTFSDLPFQHWAYGSMMEAANGHDYTREQENTYEVWTGIK